ncbi:hypothetical protein M8818_003231 [Zalaria obscura]|uniref:Uncharacterized protein n=1 Tax=Zalaria obscura TaxID=2024903 RepID=A0ACC3SGD6_9PEZI
MSAIEVAGFALSIVPILISGYASLQVVDIVTLRNFRDQLANGPNAYLVIRYGCFKAGLLSWACPDALALVERVEQSVLVEGDEGAKMMKDSMTANYNMIAVAVSPYAAVPLAVFDALQGAIIAQVAISALSLDRVAQTHWTAQAAFVTSLVSGALSVYYACVVQQTAGSLIKPDELKDWLCGSRTSDTALQTTIQRRAREIRLGSRAMMTRDEVKELLELATTEQGSHKLIPSFLSDGGPNASLAVLLFYVITAVLGLLVLYIPFGLKGIDMVSRQRSMRDARPALTQLIDQLEEALELVDQASNENRANLLREYKVKSVYVERIFQTLAPLDLWGKLLMRRRCAKHKARVTMRYGDALKDEEESPNRTSTDAAPLESGTNGSASHDVEGHGAPKQSQVEFTAALQATIEAQQRTIQASEALLEALRVPLRSTLKSRKKYAGLFEESMALERQIVEEM